jgi:hypothetical protein
VSQEVNDSAVDPEGDLLAGIPVKSRLAWSFAYEYPVHRISTDYIPSEAGDQPTFLAICRKASEDMDFMELNPVTARLLEMIADNESMTGRELLETLAEDIAYPETDTFVTHGKAALEQMRDAEILIGVK